MINFTKKTKRKMKVMSQINFLEYFFRRVINSVKNSLKIQRKLNIVSKFQCAKNSFRRVINHAKNELYSKRKNDPMSKLMIKIKTTLFLERFLPPSRKWKCWKKRILCVKDSDEISWKLKQTRCLCLIFLLYTLFETMLNVRNTFFYPQSSRN